MGSLPKINNRACVAVNTVLSKCTMNNPMRLLRSTSREVKKKNSSLWKKWTRWDWTKKIVIYKAQLANPVTAVATVVATAATVAVFVVDTVAVFVVDTVAEEATPEEMAMVDTARVATVVAMVAAAEEMDMGTAVVTALVATVVVMVATAEEMDMVVTVVATARVATVVVTVAMVVATAEDMAK